MNAIQLLRTNVRYLSNVGTTFLAQSVSAVSLIFLTPYLVQTLGVSQFGLYGVLLNIILLSSILDFGLNITLIRKLVHKHDESKALISTLFFFFLFLFITCIPVFWALYYYDILNIGGNSLPFAFFTALLAIQNVVALFFDVMIQAANKIFIGKIIRICKVVVEFCALYYFTGKGSITVLLLVSSVVNFFYIIALYKYAGKEVSIRISLKSFRLSLLFDHMRYSFWYFLAAIAVALIFYVQILLINHILGSISAAIYMLVSRFFDILKMGLTNFIQVLFPKIVHSEAVAKWDEIKALFRKVFFRITAISILSLVLMLTIGKWAFIYWSKHDDPETLRLYNFFALFITVALVDNVAVVFLSALKLNKLPTIVSIIQGIIGLVLGWVLLKKYGIIGVVWASLIAFACTNMFFNTLYLLRNINRHHTLPPQQDPA